MTRRRILVADDEEALAFGLKLNLSRAGYQVITVADGQAALEALSAGDFDCALCDLVMPGLDGMALLKALALRGVRTPVVLMSAHADVDTAMQAVHEGAVDYVAKPFRLEEVLFRLGKALNQTQLERRVESLEEALGAKVSFEGIIAQSPEMLRVFNLVRKVADFKTTVLLSGESGTGKELIARALHMKSARRDRNFVAVNCGAIPESLLESELFGHVRGAFTDASRNRRGLFEEADGGTLFLDEIGELPLALQVKLLRVLQEGEIRRVGDSQPVAVDVRVVAATVRDLAVEVEGGRFREDLYYRLNVLQVALPPLRDRRTDIPLLVEHFVQHFNQRLGTTVRGASAPAMKLLVQYAWPGNVRELQNTIERAMVLSEGDEIGLDELSPRIKETQDRLRFTLGSGELSIKKTTRVVEEELIRRALDKTGGNRTRAAEVLEISHRALLYKLKEYGITR